MLLALDIGNTNLDIGCFDGDKLVSEFRMHTDLTRTRDEYGEILCSILEKRLGEKFKIDAAVISSVVPPLTRPLAQVAEIDLGVKPLIVNINGNIGFKIKLDDAPSLGADRIVDVMAVQAQYGFPALIVDFGTATTIEYVDRNGYYCGGTISPGVELAINALVEKTAQLPRVGMAFPESVIGIDTVSAMQAGTYIGYECMIEGLIARFEEETKENFDKIITTGGLGGLISERLNKHAAKCGQAERYIYDANLTLKGIKEYWKANS